MGRLAAPLLALAVAMVPMAARGAVAKYRIRVIDIVETPFTSPPVEKNGARGTDPFMPSATAFVDAGTSGSPVLRKFRFKTFFSTTISVGISSFIFLRDNHTEGPGPVRHPSAFTGTGHTAPGSTLAWGVVTGWTITGSQFCRSAPSIICDFADHVDETTIDPPIFSDFYDLGTWTFHGTGFTATPFVHQFFTSEGSAAGNSQRWIRGVRLLDATVPALPLLAAALLGGALALGGLVALRRRDRRRALRAPRAG